MVIVAGPLLWSLLSSFKGIFEVYKSPPTMLPERFLADAYKQVVEYPFFARIAFNSLFLGFGSTVLTLLLSVLAGYGFARYRFALKGPLLMAILVPRILPRVALIIPLFRLFATLRVLDTYVPLFLTYVASGIPFATWVLTAYFSTLPVEIEDAAAVDGVTGLQLLWHIVVPMSAPAMVTAGIISFVTSWHEFPFALSFVQSTRMRTLPFQLYVVKDTIGLENWPVVLAFTILTIIPVLLLYLAFT
ncbi:MAG: carbohydrate ABC transporter permease, partial [Spirochaetaceae bacterium]